VDDAMLARFRPAQRRVVPRLVHAKQANIPACAWVSEPARELLASAR
jgi:hypothetical protein